MNTAVYHAIGKNPGYPGLGLPDETGEVFEKVDMLLSSGVSDPDGVADEIGDVYWYIAALSHELKIDLTELDGPEAAMDGFVSVPHVSAMLVSCKIAGHVKKIIREGKRGKKYATRVEDITKLLIELDTLLRMVIRFQTPYTREQVFERNINKLSDRKDRGVLHGDGDNR